MTDSSGTVYLAPSKFESFAQELEEFSNKYSEFYKGFLRKHEELHATTLKESNKLTKQPIMYHVVKGWGGKINMNEHHKYTGKNIAEQFCYSEQRKQEIIERYTLLADFYAWSIFHQDDNFEDCRLRDDIFPRIREYLLNVVHLAIVGEAGHFNFNVYSVNTLKQKGKASTKTNIVRRFQLNKNFDTDSAVSDRIRSRQVRGCKTLFKNTKAWQWSAAYGGPAWERICDRWLKLERHCDRENIDQLIDCCHNTGNVLNKSLYGIDTWLGIKTKNKDAGWLIDQCSFPRYAYRRIYEVFKISKEDFASWR